MSEHEPKMVIPEAGRFTPEMGMERVGYSTLVKNFAAYSGFKAMHHEPEKVYTRVVLSYVRDVAIFFVPLRAIEGD